MSGICSLSRRFPFALLIGGLAIFQAPAFSQTDCPAYSQTVTDGGITEAGMSNTAQIAVVLVNSASNTYSAAQTQSVQSAIDGLTSIPGNNQDASISISSSGMPDITSTGSIQNPILAVQVVANQPELMQVVPGCTEAWACTVPYVIQDGTDLGTFIGAKVYVMASQAQEYFEQLLTHELGHGIFGWNDCSADNCISSIMESNFNPATAPSAPTSCDTAFRESQVTDSSCTSDAGCAGGLVCMNGACGCASSCDAPSCSGYSCDNCGTNCEGGCTSDADCADGLVCMGGSCGCNDVCDDTACDGYSYCACNDDPCMCDGECGGGGNCYWTEGCFPYQICD